jgi:hypothetical protein
MKTEENSPLYPLPVVSDQQDEKQPVVCALLRTRGGVDDQFDGIDWQLGHSMTAAYWCLATTESVGPDDNFAHAQVCREGRSCFQKPVE